MHDRAEVGGPRQFASNCSKKPVVRPVPAGNGVANRTGLWDRAVAMQAPDPAAPWYKDGLRFACTQCGNCCTGTPGYVWVDDAEIEAIAQFLDKPIGEIRLMHTRPVRGLVSLSEFGNGECTFFDPQTRRCTIYPVRPRQCRTWPFWRSNIETPADWERTRQVCPGAGCGDLVTLEEIDVRASQIEL